MLKLHGSTIQGTAALSGIFRALHPQGLSFFVCYLPVKCHIAKAIAAVSPRKSIESTLVIDVSACDLAFESHAQAAAHTPNDIRPHTCNAVVKDVNR